MPATLPVFGADNKFDNYTPGVAAALRTLMLVGSCHLILPIARTFADATVLFTCPTIVHPDLGSNLRFEVISTGWEVTTSWTGGSSSAIGASSSNANYNTKGDLLGGSSGDVLATLVSTGPKLKGGTLGTKFGTNGRILLVAGDTILYDKIASTFTAGAGFIHVRMGLVPDA
jgi:hypothetical protein